MNKTKLFITFIILFITVGIAAVATSMAIDGSTLLSNNLDDFKVYFSNAKVNGIENHDIVTSQTTISFENTLKEPGETYALEYDVTNASKNYDAEVNVTCTNGDEYLSIVNTFDTSTLPSQTTRTGKLVLKILKSNISSKTNIYYTTCTLSASAIERDTQGTGTIPDSVNLYYIGREVSIGDEKFNVISFDTEKVTMLAQYNLGTDYRQTEEKNSVTFSTAAGWEYTPGPKEIDIQEWSTNPKEYVNNYISYLQSLTGNSNISGNLITLNELGNLGCTISVNYDDVTGCTCSSSEHKSWLLNKQKWWTRSTYVKAGTAVWVVNNSSVYIDDIPSSTSSIRPTITISRELYEQVLKYKTYEIGREISLGEEKFNVISDNGDTISMLAQYNIGADNKQTSSANYVAFSATKGWENTPGPKEIDIQEWSTNPKTILNNYTTYIEEMLGEKVYSSDLITLNQLASLGCVVPENYEYITDSSYRKCTVSPYKSWLNSEQDWWTRSAISTTSSDIWFMHDDGYLRGNTYSSLCGIRPVITIKKTKIN